MPIVEGLDEGDHEVAVVLHAGGNDPRAEGVRGEAKWTEQCGGHQKTDGDEGESKQRREPEVTGL